MEGYASELVADPAALDRILRLQRKVEARKEDAGDTTAGSVGAAGAATAAADPDTPRCRDNLATVKPGDRVEVHSLKQAAHLNGRHGVATRLDGERWVVSLEGEDREVKAKEQNLKVETTERSWNTWECTHGDAQSLCAFGCVRQPEPSEAGFGVTVQVAFRGSRNIANWITNLTASLVPTQVGGQQGRVHKGFQDAYLMVRDELHAKVLNCLTEGKIKQGHPPLILVSGHSLGAALATLVAYDFACIFKEEVRAITWGGPRVGDSHFVASYQAAVRATARFVMKADVVPRLPSNPLDSNDDGAVLGPWVRNVLQRPHEAIGVGDYVHVCAGTTLKGRGPNHLNYVLQSLATAANEGLGQGATQFFDQHTFKMYDAELQTLACPRQRCQRDEPVDNAALTAQAIGGIVQGLSNRWMNRQRNNNANNAQAAL